MKDLIGCIDIRICIGSIFRIMGIFNGGSLKHIFLLPNYPNWMSILRDRSRMPSSLDLAFHIQKPLDLLSLITGYKWRYC